MDGVINPEDFKESDPALVSQAAAGFAADWFENVRPKALRCGLKVQGLEAFAESEKAAAHRPLSGGPFKPFLSALHDIQGAASADLSPIRTALITARAAPAHERVIRTLRAWDIRIDEAIFLGGKDKGEFLRAFGADIFFDDQEGHCLSASRHVPTGHVPHGIANI